jgi:ribokinase
MDVVTPLRRLPGPGETIHVQDVSLVPGGKGANAAVAAARLGARVRMVGCVGDDAFGTQRQSSLKAEGIDCGAVRVSERSTGTAIILLNHDTGQNSIMVGPGANDEVTLPENDELFEWADMVMLQLETPLALNIEVARRASEAGVPVILDPAPAVADLPDELIRAVTIVSPNESELAVLTGMPVDTDDQAVEAARSLIARGAETVVVKLGERGALWVTPDEVRHVPAVPIRAVDTTAAGDAFTGALAVGLAEGLDKMEALERACRVGALTCTRLGAQPSIPTLQDLAEFMEEVRR